MNLAAERGVWSAAKRRSYEGFRKDTNWNWRPFEVSARPRTNPTALQRTQNHHETKGMRNRRKVFLCGPEQEHCAVGRHFHVTTRMCAWRATLRTLPVAPRPSAQGASCTRLVRLLARSYFDIFAVCVLCVCVCVVCVLCVVQYFRRTLLRLRTWLHSSSCSDSTSRRSHQSLRAIAENSFSLPRCELCKVA